MAKLGVKLLNNLLEENLTGASSLLEAAFDSKAKELREAAATKFVTETFGSKPEVNPDRLQEMLATYRSHKQSVVVGKLQEALSEELGN